MFKRYFVKIVHEHEILVKRCLNNFKASFPLCSQTVQVLFRTIQRYTGTGFCSGVLFHDHSTKTH